MIMNNIYRTKLEKSYNREKNSFYQMFTQENNIYRHQKIHIENIEHTYPMPNGRQKKKDNIVTKHRLSRDNKKNSSRISGPGRKKIIDKRIPEVKKTHYIRDRNYPRK